MQRDHRASAIAVIGLFFVSPPLAAEIGVLDPVPASSLLVPYFEVDVSDPACADPTAGVTTLIAITNTRAESTVAHVELWTDWSVPWINFDIFLTGYDVHTINLRDIFCHGDLPQTGLGSGNSPVGAISTGAPTFDDTCNQTGMAGAGPFYDPLSALAVDQLKTAFTGRPIAGLQNDCAGSGQKGPDIAVGYATVDVTTQCTELLPTSPGYFVGPGSVASDANVLLGDFFLADPGNNFSQGFTAVHLESGNAGPHTFYGRHTIANGAGPAIDGREALPTTVAARYALAGGFEETSHLIWREAGTDTSASACGSRPNWFPIDLANDSGIGPVAVFDEQESVFVPAAVSLPNAVNALAVGNTGGADVVPKLESGGFDFGWVIYNLQSSASLPTYGDIHAQAYALVAFKALGRFSAGLDGYILDNANDPTTSNPGAPQ